MRQQTLQTRNISDMSALRSMLHKLKKDDFQENIKKKTPKVMTLENITQEFLAKEAAGLDNIFTKLSPKITDVFLALGNYDVRFDFDPFSIDDCRCSIVSPRQVNVLCSLKHVPVQSIIIEDGGLPGRVCLKLKDDYFKAFNVVSWEDFLDLAPDNARYVNSNKVYECLAIAVRIAVDEVCKNMVDQISFGVLESSARISLWFKLSDDDFYRVNLFPSIRVNSSCDNFQYLLKKISSVPQKLLDVGCFEQGMHIVANPTTDSNSKEHEEKFWSLTFNDIERRVILSKNFDCAEDCLTLLKQHLTLAVYEDKNLSFAQLQAIVLKEIFRKPNSKDWKRQLLHKRMRGVMRCLKDCLRTGRCENVFTGVNLFASINKATLEKMDELATDFLERKILKFYT